MDHYLKGIDNGLDVQAPFDIFVIGNNMWQKEREWPFARTVWTNFYLRQNGKLETTAPRSDRRTSTHTTPAIPLRFSSTRTNSSCLHEDYRTVDSELKYLVTYKNGAARQNTEITGAMNATVWAVTDGASTGPHSSSQARPTSTTSIWGSPPG